MYPFPQGYLSTKFAKLKPLYSVYFFGQPLSFEPFPSHIINWLAEKCRSLSTIGPRFDAVLYIKMTMELHHFQCTQIGQSQFSITSWTNAGNSSHAKDDVI